MYSVSMIVFAAALGLATPPHAKISPAEVGAVVPDFSLKDIHRRPRSLDGFKDKKAFVVVFVDTECPVADLYVPTLIELHRKYAGKGVQFLAINSSSAGLVRQRVGVCPGAGRPVPGAQRLRPGRLRMPSVPSGRPRRSCSTPERVIRYHGRIDDQYGSRLPPRQADESRPRAGPRRTAGGQADHHAADRSFGLPDRTLAEAPRRDGA